jgi:hypothetical protein
MHTSCPISTIHRLYKEMLGNIFDRRIVTVAQASVACPTTHLGILSSTGQNKGRLNLDQLNLFL